MSAKYTPGPWRMDPTEDIGWWQIGTPEKPVCIVQTDEDEDAITEEEAKANACLISRAPKLLEALKGLLLELGVNGGTVPAKSPACAAAREAVREAES